jgi:uncharacterized protein (TIGR00661 family)
MRFLFMIQGEGRGHCTQAVALKELIESRGHTVCHVAVGTNGARPLEMFRKEFGGITRIASPSFGYIWGNRISLIATVFNTVRNLGAYKASLGAIGALLAQHKPDAVINFYEPLYGVYQWLNRKSTGAHRSFSIGHQFMFHHPSYPRKHGKFLFQRWIVSWWTAVVGSCSRKIALSFYEAPDHGDIAVVPPILRNRLFEVDARRKDGDYILAYVLNPGYANEIKTSLRRTREAPQVHVFCERADEMDTEGLNIRFYALNGDRFLEQMAEAQSVICTAGFESAAEARYLGKPLLMVPVRGHCEQFYNAIDACNQGFGIYANRFSLERILRFRAADNRAYRVWVDSGKERLIKVLGL